MASSVESSITRRAQVGENRHSENSFLLLSKYIVTYVTQYEFDMSMTRSTLHQFLTDFSFLDMIEKLPPEILLQILQKIEIADILINVACTCRHLRRFVGDFMKPESLYLREVFKSDFSSKFRKLLTEVAK